MIHFFKFIVGSLDWTWIYTSSELHVSKTKFDENKFKVAQDEQVPDKIYVC